LSYRAARITTDEIKKTSARLKQLSKVDLIGQVLTKVSSLHRHAHDLANPLDKGQRRSCGLWASSIVPCASSRIVPTGSSATQA
jgi:hypothetical protein